MFLSCPASSFTCFVILYLQRLPVSFLKAYDLRMALRKRVTCDNSTNNCFCGLGGRPRTNHHGGFETVQYIHASTKLFFATASVDVEATITKCRQSLLLPPEVPGCAATVRHKEPKSLVSATIYRDAPVECSRLARTSCQLC